MKTLNENQFSYKCHNLLKIISHKSIYLQFIKWTISLSEVARKIFSQLYLPSNLVLHFVLSSYILLGYNTIPFLSFYERPLSTTVYRDYNIKGTYLSDSSSVFQSNPRHVLVSFIPFGLVVTNRICFGVCYTYVIISSYNFALTYVSSSRHHLICFPSFRDWV